MLPLLSIASWINPKRVVPFSDTLHKAKDQNVCVTEKKLGKYFVKNDKAQKQTSFGFFVANWFNGFIVLLNNNISNFILGNKDLKLGSFC